MLNPKTTITGILLIIGNVALGITGQIGWEIAIPQIIIGFGLIFAKDGGK